MNYVSLYNNIVSQYKRTKLDCYTEKHHIIPRCAGGTDDDDNLVDLPARVHYICHRILVKLYSGSIKHKLASAFWAMSNQTSERMQYLKITSRMYETAKMMFIESYKYRPKHKRTFEHIDALRSGHAEYMANNKEEFSQKIKDSYTDERRERIRQMTLQHWQDPEYREKVIANSKAAYTNERRDQTSIQSKERWKDPEYRAKCSNSIKAHYASMTEEERQSLCQSKKDQVTDETRQKLSEISKKHSATTHAKITCEHCNTEVSKPNYSKYHGDKCKVLTGIDFKPEKTPCKYCGKLCAPALLNRWHNENCKNKESNV